MEERRLLQSWKEIASYLDCSLRTCHRWEESLDLPIHRLDGTPKARVFAYVDELDRWRVEKLSHTGRRENEAISPVRDPRKWLWILPAAALVAAGVFFIPRFLSPGLLPIPEDKPTLAVVTFGTAGPDERLEAWRTALPDLLITDLDQSRFVTVFPITQTYRRLRELGLADAGEFSAEDLGRVAEAAKVRYVATGSLGRSGPEVKVSVVVHDVTTGKTEEPCLASFQDDTEVFAAADTLSRKVKEALGLDRRHIARDIDEKVADVSTGSKQAFLLYSQGYRLAGIANYQESQAILQQAVEADPGFALGYKTLWGTAIRLLRREEARAYLEKALDLSGQLSERERGQTRVHFCENYDEDPKGNMVILERLCRFYPDDWLGSQRLAPTYADREEWDKAREIGEMSWRVNKGDGRVTFNLPGALLMAYENLGQGDKASRLLDDCINDPAFPWGSSARSYRLGFLVRQGRFDEALAEVEAMAAERPEHPDRFFWVGKVHLHRDDFAGAEREFLKSVDQREPFIGPDALTALSDLSLAQGKVGEAIERMRRRFEMVEGREGTPAAYRQGVEVDCHQRLARLYRLSNRLPEAAREIEAASRIIDSATSPRLTVLLETLHLSALIALDTGREEEFEGLADRIKRSVELQGFPRLMRTYYYLLGYRELKRNDLDRAIMFFGKSVDLMSVPGRLGLQKDEADPQFLFALAEAYDRRESRSTLRALPAFERITQPVFSRSWSRGDLYAKSFYHMARIYESGAGFRYATAAEARERREKAVKNYRKFLSLWGDADPVFAPMVEDARARLAAIENRRW